MHEDVHYNTKLLYMRVCGQFLKSYDVLHRIVQVMQIQIRQVTAYNSNQLSTPSVILLRSGIIFHSEELLRTLQVPKKKQAAQNFIRWKCVPQIVANPEFVVSTGLAKNCYE